MATPPLIDSLTAYSAVGGAIAGARAYPPLTALGVCIGLEVIETFKQRSMGVAPPPNDVQRHLVCIGASMVAYYVARAMAHP